MSHARVYINGQEAGYWPYGYNTFYLDVTPYLKEGTKNTLAVRLENETESSRWYPGAGLYRNVHLVVTEDAHIPTWGTQLTTPVVKDDYAKVNIKTTLVVPSGKQFDAYRIVTELKDKDGKVVTTDENKVPVLMIISSARNLLSVVRLYGARKLLFFIRLSLKSMKAIY